MRQAGLRGLSLKVIAPSLAALAVFFAAAAGAQVVEAAGAAVEFRAVPNHVPSWANAENFVESLPAEQKVPALTLLLVRDADRQQAFEQLLADQQNPASAEYHHWLTSKEIGERFGLADGEIDSIAGWLESEGLHVDLVAPTRDFINFSGTASDLGRAFKTRLNYYTVKGKRRMSIESAPMIPEEIAPRVKGIQGLYTVENRPMSHAVPAINPHPEFTNGSTYFVSPRDFATIYDLPNDLTGNGVTIGIVARSRTDFDDFKNFRQLTGTTFANPSEIVPTAYGGVDPGPALTAPPSSGVIGDQLEAELDVFRAASIAQSAKVLVIVNKSYSDGGSDIEGDAQYLIESDPAPAQVINISFGACEAASDVGLAGVQLWDGLFSSAAMKGISVFVASGDAGAAGCDGYLSTPPASPAPNSPNYICSSSYATCMGGTEFADSIDPTKYWSAGDSSDLSSALSYIPEGAWNEPLNSNGPTQAASSGGGVSMYIPTPSWQTGKGVPAARAGRYTPDLAFSASGHDGYFGCMAAVYVDGGSGNAGCDPPNGGYSFVYFYGTSAAAPDMAGITALLDEKMGAKGQGNLNPVLYSLAASTPSAFHDVTIASSGVANCSVNTPSMCNNSIPGPTGLSGGEAGYLVGTGYDEVTGLGSLDVANFIEAIADPAAKPGVATGAASAVTNSTVTLAGRVNPERAATKYWFLYGVSSTLAGAAKTASQSLSGSAAVSVTAKLTGLKPVTKYYFQLQALNSVGAADGSIASFTTSKASQAIAFTLPVSVKYGIAPIALTAKASSGLPVIFKLISGPARLKGDALTVTGAGTIVIAANQAGNSTYAAAHQVERKIAVTKTLLTVTAKNKTMIYGGAVPLLTYEMSGWVNGDTRGTATKGGPSLTSAVTSKTPVGKYPITITGGTGPKRLTSANYTFKFMDGWLFVTK